MPLPPTGADLHLHLRSLPSLPPSLFHIRNPGWFLRIYSWNYYVQFFACPSGALSLIPNPRGLDPFSSFKNYFSYCVLFFISWPRHCVIILFVFHPERRVKKGKKFGLRDFVVRGDCEPTKTIFPSVPRPRTAQETHTSPREITSHTTRIHLTPRSFCPPFRRQAHGGVLHCALWWTLIAFAEIEKGTTPVGVGKLLYGRKHRWECKVFPR